MFNKVALIMMSAALFGACSSVPDFKPSRSIEEATSFEDAIGICNEYQIDGPKNDAGTPELSRASVLIPWMRCYEKITTRFPQAKENFSFLFFFRELNGRYDSAHPSDAKIIDWISHNMAVRALSRFWQSPAKGLSLSDDEQKAVQRAYPQTAMYLVELGLMKAPAESKMKWSDPELEAMRIDFGKGSRFKKYSAPGTYQSKPGLTDNQRVYCMLQEKFLKDYDSADDMARYLHRVDLAQPQSVLRDKLAAKLTELKTKLRDQKSELDTRRSISQKDRAAFVPGDCL